MDTWRTCVVTMFDLIGTRAAAASGNASSQMIKMHESAAWKINSLERNQHGYVWNDSIMLLSYDAGEANLRRELLQELNHFKQWIENRVSGKFYAISVKGKAFPNELPAAPVFEGQIADQPKAIILKTSSWAMANCFLIESALKHHRANWYIDARITQGVSIETPHASEDVELYPGKEKRTIQMYMNSLPIR